MKHQSKARQRFSFDVTVLGPLFMVASALMFTMLNVSVKLFGDAYSAWHITFYRFIGGLLILLPVLGRRKNPYAANNIRLLIFRGCLAGVTFVALIASVQLLPISTALVVFYSFPAFSAVFSYVLYRESISRPQIACIVLAITGIAVLLDFRSGGNLTGLSVALAASAMAGLTVTIVRELRKSNGSLVIYLYVCTFGALVTLPKFIAQPMIPLTAAGWVFVVGVILFGGTGQVLMNQGYLYCSSWEGGVLMSSEVVFTVTIGILLLGDPVTWRFFAGGLMILISTVILNRLKATEIVAESVR
jgi:drug/metabolite transporter (DMT)-like permease